MRKAIKIICLCSTVLICPEIWASPITIRYALIVGNNNGIDENGRQPLAGLLHAERDAGRIRDILVKRAHFDESEKRTKLLIGAGPSEVKAALQSLIDQKEKDKAYFKDVSTFFFFYFSGHGLNGSLLLNGGALSAEEAGNIFTAFNATFSAAVFDSCFSGSLGDTALRAKSIEPSEGFDVIRKLSKDVLTAEGRIWFVSSDASGESFEDTRLGGVFTHFFIEAMEKADNNKTGVSIDRIWEYARENTVRYTTKKKRPQFPERYISKLKSGSPIYLSFPQERSATLSLDDNLLGQITLAYDQGHHTEIVHKGPGKTESLPIYPGTIYVISDGGFGSKVHSLKRITLQDGDTLRLSTINNPKPNVSVGSRVSDTAVIENKHRGQTITAKTVRPGVSLLAGVGYSLEITHPDLLQTRHGFAIPLRIDYKHITVKVEVIAGYDTEKFPAWQFKVWRVGGTATGGAGLDFSAVRLTGTVGLGLFSLFQQYETGEKRNGIQLYPHVEIGLLFPRNGSFMGQLQLNGGPISSPGIGMDTKNHWSAAMGAGLSLFHRFL